MIALLSIIRKYSPMPQLKHGGANFSLVNQYSLPFTTWMAHREKYSSQENTKSSQAYNRSKI